MIYDRGDLIVQKNIIFKDTEELDLRIGGHPTTIVLDVKEQDEFMYYLTLTSKVEYINRNPLKYLLVKPDKYNKLRKPSLINLANIYKEPRKIIVSKGYLRDEDYDKMLDKLNSYQCKVSMDPVYKEIQHFLNTIGA